MLGSIVSTVSEDGVRLHGFYAMPRDVSKPTWILFHGVNSNFYGSGLLRELAREISSWGCGVILTNSRGHDLCSVSTSPVPRRIGSMFETIHECIHDVNAWIEFARSESPSGGISLVGHSLGAVKLAYYLRHETHPDIRCSVLISPPRLNTELLLQDSRKADVFRQQLDKANELCASGDPSKVIRVRFPIPNWLSAATFVDKYGSFDRYDYLSHIGQIAVPTLWVFGRKEVEGSSINFRAAHENLAEQFKQLEPARQALHSVECIPGAEHSFDGCYAELRNSLSSWVSSIRE